MEKNCYNCIYSREKAIILGYEPKYKFDNIYCKQNRDYPLTYCKLDIECPYWEPKYRGAQVKQNKDNIILPYFMEYFLEHIELNKEHHKFAVTLNDEDLHLLYELKEPFHKRLTELIGDYKSDLEHQCLGIQTLKITKITDYRLE